MPQPFADPYSALSRGLESGTRMGLMLKNQQAEEDKFEFMKLQTELEGKRSQDKADRDVRLDKFEKTFGFHMKTRNVPGALDALRLHDKSEGTDLALRVTPERASEFYGKMEGLKKVDPALQGELMEGILRDFPVLSHLSGGREGMGLTRTRPGDKKGAPSIDKKSKDAFAYVKTMTQKPDELGMVQVLDTETAGNAIMLIDDLFKQYKDASPQRIGEMALRKLRRLSESAQKSAKTSISKEPPAAAPEGGGMEVDITGDTVTYQGKTYNLGPDGTVMIDGRKFRVKQ